MYRLVLEANGSVFLENRLIINTEKWLRNIVLHFQIYYS